MFLSPQILPSIQKWWSVRPLCYCYPACVDTPRCHWGLYLMVGSISLACNYCRVKPTKYSPVVAGVNVIAQSRRRRLIFALPFCGNDIGGTSYGWNSAPGAGNLSSREQPRQQDQSSGDYISNSEISQLLLIAHCYIFRPSWGNFYYVQEVLVRECLEYLNTVNTMVHGNFWRETKIDCCVNGRTFGSTWNSWERSALGKRWRISFGKSTRIWTVWSIGKCSNLHQDIPEHLDLSPLHGVSFRKLQIKALERIFANLRPLTRPRMDHSLLLYRSWWS